MPKERAVFLDRDGVINELVYNSEADLSESPRSSEQFRLLPRVGEAIRTLNQSGFKVIVVSNQPDIAKGKTSEEAFNQIRRRMIKLLAKSGAHIDGEYYCFHHPHAVVRKYRRNCQCRKPKPGLILKATREMLISPGRSYMIGDRPADIIAGRAAKCNTVWLNDMKCEYCTIMRRMRVQPKLIFRNLFEATAYITKH